jgi:hypothetical protein
MGQMAENADDRSSNSAVLRDSGPHVSEDQLVALRRDGFLLVEGLSSDEELAALRALFDRMFSERRGWDAGDLFDMVGPDTPERELALPQLLRPSRYEPLLRQTKLASNAHSIAEQILGPKLENDLEHAISKPAFTGAATPWHQDDAFHRKGSGVPESISVRTTIRESTD